LNTTLVIVFFQFEQSTVNQRTQIPIIAWEDGERFECGENGHGLVLPGGKVFIIEGEGGRSGYKFRKEGLVPRDTRQQAKIPVAEITFALDCVSAILEAGSYKKH